MMHWIITETVSRCGSRPPLLHHYTGQNGIIGILKSGEIWASNCQYLNDGQELLLSLNVARQRMRQLQSASADPVKIARLERMHGWTLGLEWMNIFVTSFCCEGDLLSQWRGYGGQNAGYSIELSSDKLEQLALESGFYLLPCLYDTKQQQSVISRLVDTYADEPDDKVPEFIDTLAVLSVMIKHEAFSQENEWRLISRPNHAQSPHVKALDPSRLDFRAGVSTVVPYYRIPLQLADGTFPIEGFIIGPTPHPHLASRAISMLNMSSLKLAAVIGRQLSLTGLGEHQTGWVRMKICEWLSEIHRNEHFGY